MTERCARFRLGDEFVDSGSYWHYKTIARSVVEQFSNALGLELVGHPQALLADSGFSLDAYASTDKAYDIHVCPDYYAFALEQLALFLQSGKVSGIESTAGLSKGLSKFGKLSGVATNLIANLDRFSPRNRQQL